MLKEACCDPHHLLRLTSSEVTGEAIVDESPSGTPGMPGQQGYYNPNTATNVWCASGWNDNGYIAAIDDVDDPQWQSHGSPKDRHTIRTLHTLLLTDYFPGLGWMMRRDVWLEELGPNWQDYPTTGWDHFVRTLPLGDCVFPLVPRTKHIGNAHGSNVVGGRKQEYTNMAFN